MPDISKLPELAGIFEVSLDELLGEKSSLVEAAVEDKLDECVKDGKLDAFRQGQNITIYLPFMDEDDVKELMLMVMKSNK